MTPSPMPDDEPTPEQRRYLNVIAALQQERAWIESGKFQTVEINFLPDSVKLRFIHHKSIRIPAA